MPNQSEFEKRVQTGVDIWSHPRVETIGGLLERVRIIGNPDNPRGLIARLHLDHNEPALAPPSQERYLYLFYPHPRDIARFAEKAQHLAEGGPTSTYPGAVGALLVSEKNRGKKAKRIILRYAQGCFKTKTREHDGVSRSLATSYGGWQNYLFDEIHQRAIAQHATIHYWIESGKDKSFDELKYKGPLKKMAFFEMEAKRRESKTRKIKRVSNNLTNRESHRLIIRPK